MRHRLLIILALALILRLALIFTVGNIELVGDEVDFNHLAGQLRAGEGFGYGTGADFVPTT